MKEFKSLSGFQNHIFFHEEDKKNGSARHANRNSLMNLNCLDISPHTWTLKPYKCASKTCPKFKEGFKSQQALNRHMDIHKGNLIKCNVQGCPKSFTTHHYLRDHKNMAHGLPYECKHVLDGCTFTCKSRKTLLDHHKLYCPFNLDRSDVN